MQDDISVSFLSGKGGQLEKHHIMNGNPYREYAEIYGLWVMLTPEEHRWLHDTSQGRKYGRLLKAMAQEVANANGTDPQVVTLLQAILQAINSLDLSVELDGEKIKNNTVSRINQHTRTTGRLELII